MPLRWRPRHGVPMFKFPTFRGRRNLTQPPIVGDVTVVTINARQVMRSEQWKSGASVLGLVLGLAMTSVAAGQAPPPPVPVPTVWDKLGVTGACKCLHSKLINPHGNHPQCEKKPLLKMIADPANLD